MISKKSQAGVFCTLLFALTFISLPAFAQNLNHSLTWDFVIAGEDAQNLHGFLDSLETAGISSFHSSDKHLSLVCPSSSQCVVKMSREAAIVHGDGYLYLNVKDYEDFVKLRTRLPENQDPVFKGFRSYNKFGDSFFLACTNDHKEVYSCMAYFEARLMF